MDSSTKDLLITLGAVCVLFSPAIFYFFKAITNSKAADYLYINSKNGKEGQEFRLYAYRKYSPDDSMIAVFDSYEEAVQAAAKYNPTELRLR